MGCFPRRRAAAARHPLRRRVWFQRPNAPPFLHRHAERRQGQPDGGKEQRPADGVPQAGVSGTPLSLSQKAPVPAAGCVGAAHCTLRRREEDRRRQQRLRLHQAGQGAQRADEVIWGYVVVARKHRKQPAITVKAPRVMDFKYR